MKLSIVLTVGLCLAAAISHAQSPSPWACNVSQLPITGNVVNVSSESALQTAMGNLNNGDTILIADGTYNLTKTLYVSGKSNVTIRGTSGCDGVVLLGLGMDNQNFGNVQEGIWSDSPNTTVAHLTIKDTWENELIFNYGAQAPHVYSVKLINSGSQFIKSNPSSTTGVGNNNGVVEYSWFEYLSGPPSNANHAGGSGYTNGMSLHAEQNWVIRGNLFKNFHTPDSSSYAWNPAVLIWNHSANTITEKNVFINVDRAIAYGLVERNPGYDHQGGVIRNNFVTYTPGLMSASRTASSDGAIIVWDSPNTLVYHNTILTNGNVVHSIEFRFVESVGGEARNNLADSTINLRDSATDSESGNLLSAAPSMFVNPAIGDLHLLPTATAAIDQAPALPAVTDDIDGASRPQGCCYDIGADEFDIGGSSDGGPLPPGGDGGGSGGGGGPSNTPDSGQRSDGGTSGQVVGNCGCTGSANGPVFALTLVVALQAVLRRKGGQASSKAPDS